MGEENQEKEKRGKREGRKKKRRGEEKELEMGEAARLFYVAFRKSKRPTGHQLPIKLSRAGRCGS